MTYKERYEYQKEITLKQREEINRQKAEIERLMNAYKQVAWERDALLKGSVTEEYPHCVLCGNGAIFTKSLEEYDKLIADIQAEAIKEFAERLKEEASFECDVSLGFGRPCYEDAVPIIAIDDLVKEMVGDV